MWPLQWAAAELRQPVATARPLRSQPPWVARYVPAIEPAEGPGCARDKPGNRLPMQFKLERYVDRVRHLADSLRHASGVRIGSAPGDFRPRSLNI
jgi:hypothetical protein